MLLTDQQQLTLAVAEQQAALAVELALQDANSAADAAPAPGAAAPRPGLDVIAMLRGQKEALKAQHEASLAVSWGCLVPA